MIEYSLRSSLETMIVEVLKHHEHESVVEIATVIVDTVSSKCHFELNYNCSVLRMHLAEIIERYRHACESGRRTARLETQLTNTIDMCLTRY